MCPDGFVYNLEVEKYHTYIANGIVVHNCQHIGADTFSKYAFIQTEYRLGMTGSAVREDGREYWIVALNGKPFHIPWPKLIAAGVLKHPKPHVINTARKKWWVDKLLKEHRSGQVLIFCDWLKEGQALANELGVPFVHGDTKHNLATLQDNPVCVVSRVADTTLDLPHLTLVIDYGFQRNARAQGAQRFGRLLHSESGGDYYLLLTPEEAAKEPRRLLLVEQEMLGLGDIEHIDDAGEKAKPSKPVAVKKTVKPDDAIGRALASPGVQSLLDEAYAKSTAHVKQKGTIHLALRLAWTEPVQLADLKRARNFTPYRMAEYKAAFLAAEQVGLVKQLAGGYKVDQALIQRMETLTQKYGKTNGHRNK